jgi:drug/metabolite transporter (DMT)-like permease
VLRHEFQPGKLVAGVFLALAGAMFAGDAGGLWETPWFAVIPVVTGGLCLAGAVGVLTRGIRRRRAAVAGKGAGEAQLDAPGP